MESNTQFIGRLVPTNTNDKRLSLAESNLIKQYILSKPKLNFEIYVASANNLKVDASKTGVKNYLSSLKTSTVLNGSIKGYDTSSDIDEQPHGDTITKIGATNRLKNLLDLMKCDGINVNKPDTLHILIALENGLILEEYTGDIDANIFRQDDRRVWIDRCVCSCLIVFEDQRIHTITFSEGVTTPKAQVEQSCSSNWTKTAGSFISEKYGWNAKDWHGGICGKSRQVIMEELITNAFSKFENDPCCIPIPKKEFEYKPNVFHQYNNEKIDFFVPTDIDNLLKPESLTDENAEDLKMWRSVHSMIPQLNKPGADNINPPNSIGPILTEDIIVAYFDEKDVLHIILVWPKGESTDLGWCLPGKRDRAYDKTTGDLSVKDANFSLVEKEIGVSRSNILYHTILGYFDDRERESRMIASGFVSFALLRDMPQLIPGKRISVPINAFIQLAKREIKIPDYVGSSNMCGIAKNHDSLILSLINTTAFNCVMEKVKINQLKYRNTNKRPSFSDIEVNYECGICTCILVDAKIICNSGHTLCGPCTKIIKQQNRCPYCREILLGNPINNRLVDDIIKEHYPVLYEERYLELFGKKPTSWMDDAMFNGTTIRYSS